MDWLNGDRRFPGEPRFEGLAMIARVQAEVERNGQTTLAPRYYLSSAKLSPEQLARAVRAHGGIENPLHWVMDVVFHDDLMRWRTENEPANMATIRPAALNLIGPFRTRPVSTSSAKPLPGTKTISSKLSPPVASDLQAIALVQ